MPFLDSSTIRPLYDVHDGGPPLGFRCWLTPWDSGSRNGDNKNLHTVCGRVTRSLRGMVQHQRMVHGIRQQAEFNFESIAQTNEQNR